MEALSKGETTRCGHLVIRTVLTLLGQSGLSDTGIRYQVSGTWYVTALTRENLPIKCTDANNHNRHDTHNYLVRSVVICTGSTHTLEVVEPFSLAFWQKLSGCPLQTLSEHEHGSDGTS